MLFVKTPRPRRRLPAFAGSTVLHCVVLAALATWSVKAPNDDEAVGRVNRKYSVRFLRLQTAQEHRERAGSGTSQAGASLRQSGGLQSPASGMQPRAASAPGTAEAVSRIQPMAREHRLFELPPTARVDPVKQTLVQLDLPPDIVLKHEIAIPAALLWTQRQTPPPMRKQFVAPPLKHVLKTAQSLPVPAMLTPPNLEVHVSDLNVGATFLNDTPRLVRPQAMATPVSRAAPEPAKEIPQVALADSSESIPANVISLPEAPLRSSTIIVLPPVNQIAPSAADNSAREGDRADGTQGTGDQGQGRGASGSGGTGTEAAGNGGSGPGSQGSGSNSGGSGSVNGASGDAGGRGSGAGTAGSGVGGGAGVAAAGNGTGNASSGSGAGRSGAAGGSSGSGASGSADGSAGALTGGIAGATRLTLPKEGHYGVVVVGSAPAAPYPESVGALSGKMVYTVYLRVGLRKNWILQYCLPKTAEQLITSRGSATPLDAPWPFLILRPDQLSSSGEDYVMVHGMITAEGQFDQLAMVFPEQLEKKDLLMSSLSKWEFRPASRDKVPTSVEILLIIPREPD